MIDFGKEEPSIEFRAMLEDTIDVRVQRAKPVETLAPIGDSVLELVQEESGELFVRRSYTPRGISGIEASGLSFRDAWRTMHEIFGAADIPIVRSGIAMERSEESAHPVVVVSEYLSNARPLIEASTETKQELVQKLPDLFKINNGVVLSPEVVRGDMFKFVLDETGKEQVFLVDVDPLLTQPFFGTIDSVLPFYIERFSEIMWDKWCKPEERAEVITEFIKPTGILLDHKLDDPTSLVTQKFMNAHTMCQGLDPRELGFKF